MNCWNSWTFTLSRILLIFNIEIYSKINSGGLVNGKIAMWQHRPGSYLQEHWTVLPTIDLSDSFIQIQWSAAHPLLAANNISDVIILNEQPISTSIGLQVCIILIQDCQFIFYGILIHHGQFNRPVVIFFPTYYDVIVTSSKSRKSQKYTIFVKTCYFDNFKLLYPML